MSAGTEHVADGLHRSDRVLEVYEQVAAEREIERTGAVRRQVVDLRKHLLDAGFEQLVGHPKAAMQLVPVDLGELLVRAPF